LKDVIGKAQEGDEEYFQLFFDALKGVTIPEEVTDDENEKDDE